MIRKNKIKWNNANEDGSLSQSMSKPCGFYRARFDGVVAKGFRKQPTVEEHVFGVENLLDKPVNSSFHSPTSGHTQKGLNHWMRTW